MERNAGTSPVPEATSGSREVDARARARATLLQGVAAAGITVALFAAVTWSTTQGFGLGVVLASLATAGMTALLTYIQRAYVDPYRSIRASLLLSASSQGRSSSYAPPVHNP